MSFPEVYQAFSLRDLPVSMEVLQRSDGYIYFFPISESTEYMLIIFTYRDSEFVAFDPADEKQRCVLPIFYIPDK